jgi:ATP-dependent Lon protease
VRRDIAMTGEVTLRGNASVYRGGRKEKPFGGVARRDQDGAGSPRRNVKDLADTPDNVKEGLIYPCDPRAMLKHALVSEPQAVECNKMLRCGERGGGFASEGATRPEPKGATAHTLGSVSASKCGRWEKLRRPFSVTSSRRTVTHRS